MVKMLFVLFLLSFLVFLLGSFFKIADCSTIKTVLKRTFWWFLVPLSIALAISGFIVSIF